MVEKFVSFTFIVTQLYFNNKWYKIAQSIFINKTLQCNSLRKWSHTQILNGQDVNS